MQADVRSSRSPPLGLRARSRSPDARRARHDEVTILEENGVLSRRVNQYTHSSHEGHVYPKWKMEETSIPESRGLHSNNVGLYPNTNSGSIRPITTGPEHLTGILQPTTEGTIIAENAPIPPDPDWSEFMTFRTFIITRVDEMSDAATALAQYKQYKKEFQYRYTLNAFWQIKNIPAIIERYNPRFQLLHYEEAIQRCRLEASQFVKLLAEERFIGVSLTEHSSSTRPIMDTMTPFYLLIGPSLGTTTPPTPLTGPLWIPPDPDIACLCWKRIPNHITKLDIKEHLTVFGALDGLIDITLTLPDNFEFVLTGNDDRDSKRTAWMKFTSEEACAAAELKLEGTSHNRATCRPLQRIPNASGYLFRVAPSEVCHPARILRDLHLSAHLILKLDRAFGVLELLGVPDGPDVSFASACSVHPVLAEFPNVFNSYGRSAEEQLDLQLLYLRVTHCVCYYSGRRFVSPRALWEEVGALYIRPRVNQNDVLSELLGFEASDSSTDWNPQYIKALDILELVHSPSSTNPQEILDENDETRRSQHDMLFLQSDSPEYTFEPVKTEHPVVGKMELMDIKINIKDEDSMTDIEKDIAVSQHQPISIKTEHTRVVMSNTSNSTMIRGFNSPWLHVLDSRILRLLNEDFSRPEPIDEGSGMLPHEWQAFCDNSVREVEAEKWRCLRCSKLFKGREFVYKHLKNKHNPLLPGITREKERREAHAYKNDPFKIPIQLPKPTPYLYRTGNVRQSRRHGSPTLSASIPVPHIGGAMTSMNLPSNSSFNTFLPNAGGPRLGIHGSRGLTGLDAQYKDLDQPKMDYTAAVSGGNIRATIQYDDL